MFVKRIITGTPLLTATPSISIIRLLDSTTDNPQRMLNTVKRILLQYQHMFQQVLWEGSTRDLWKLSV